MQGKAFWFGREVEGRFTGIMTCFVRSEMPLGENLLKGVVHLYFTIEWMREKKNHMAIELVLDKNILITCEVDEQVLVNLSDSIRIRAHLIYRIQTDALYLLKDTDSVALDVAPYDVKITTLHHFQKVKPQDYTHDIERL